MSRPKLLILGSGWGGTSLLRAIRNPGKYDITIASARDHMLFTPLLTSTATGSLEHRSIIEPIRPLATQKGAQFFNARATRIEHAKSTVTFELPMTSSITNSLSKQQLSSTTEPLPPATFTKPYDVLVVGVGATINTFGVPGVREYASFMKEASHARAVRRKMHDAFEMASTPVVTSAHERRALLTFVVCGAGPTGVELTAEMADWLRDLALSRRYDREVVDDARVILVEASGNILSSFDTSLRQYALRRLRAARVEVKLGARVQRIEENAVVLSEGALEERVPCGLVVWTAGIGPTDVIANENNDLEKNEGLSHLMTDEYLLCKSSDSNTSNENSAVFAIGDCARIRNSPLVPIAQVAEQQGIYVAGLLDAANGTAPNDFRSKKEPFRFASKGMLAYVGSARGVAALNTGGVDGSVMKWSGFSAWLVWRFAYLSRLGSLRNKLQVPLDWFKTALFGRDVSSF